MFEMFNHSLRSFVLNVKILNQTSVAIEQFEHLEQFEHYV